MHCFQQSFPACYIRDAQQDTGCAYRIGGGCVRLCLDQQQQTTGIDVQGSTAVERSGGQDIAARTSETNWVGTEVSRLRANASNQWMHADTWLSPGLILMTNGDWIAYSNVCRKEKSRIHDLFIGRGSDGKWYYSTYHFCINMITVRIRSDIEGAHASLLEFSNDYHLREFDGRSDVCLQKIWPRKRD